MPRCSFCKENYEFPRGLTYVLNDGNILYFCSSKCRKNLLFLKRDNKKVNWVRSNADIAVTDAAAEAESDKLKQQEKVANQAAAKQEVKKSEVRKA